MQRETPRNEHTMAKEKKNPDDKKKPKKPRVKKMSRTDMTAALERLAKKVGELRIDEPLPPITPFAGETLVHRSPLVFVADAAMDLERVRVAAQVRKTHLARRGQRCPHTEQVLEWATVIEYAVDRMLEGEVAHHPTFPWCSRVKGTGGELIGKVLGHIERFGRFYPAGDLMIPRHVTRAPIMVPVPVPGKPDEFEEKPMVWVEGIERCTKPSALRKYACLIPGAKRETGKEAPGNYELRTSLFRLGTSMMKAQGKFAEFYYDYKNRITNRCNADGTKICPTPSGRFCSTCKKEVHMKKARFCPDCGNELSLKTEPEGVLFEGHLHMMAIRRMMQLFLDLLWTEWRSALSLPLRDPYPIEYLGHSTIMTPEMFCDRAKEVAA